MDLVLLAWDFLISSLVVRPFLFPDFLAIFLTLHPAAFLSLHPGAFGPRHMGGAFISGGVDLQGLQQGRWQKDAGRGISTTIVLRISTYALARLLTVDDGYWYLSLQLHSLSSFN
jgi:hypothetical protein